MAHFYGTLQGTRGEATRCGTKRSGIAASAQSWDGSVTVSLRDNDGVTFVSVQTAGGSTRGGRTVYDGPLADLLDGSLALVNPAFKVAG